MIISSRKTRWNFSRPRDFERTALDDDFAFVGEERVVLRLVAEHGVELLVELDLDAGWQFFREAGAQIFDHCADMSAVAAGLRRATGDGGLKAALQHRGGIGRDEVDAVGIDFDDLRALRLAATRSSS